MPRLATMSCAIIMACAVAQGSLSLVGPDGQGLPIVFPAVQAEQLRPLAEEVQRYLTRCTGAQHAVSPSERPREARGILLDLFSWPEIRNKLPPEQLQLYGYCDLPAEGFVVRTLAKQRRVCILAEDLAGLRFGAYTMLEALGVRWLFPGEVGEVVPAQPMRALPDLDLKQSPDFEHRNIWYAYGGRTQKERSEYAAWQRHNKMGGVRAHIGHNLARVVPPKLYDAHPEYFPLIGGERRRPGHGDGWQPCTSNPEVVQLAIQAALKAFDADPTSFMYSLSPNDGYGWCQCDKCRALDPPDHRDSANQYKARRMVIFANQVAEAVSKKYPHKYLGFYAYAGTVEPPEDLKVHPNVIVGLAHYGYVGCNYHALTDANCKNNRKFLEYLEGWAKICNHLWLREYYTTLARPYMGLTRVAAARSIAQDIPYLKAHHVLGINSESVRPWGICGLNFYVAARLMWDSSLKEQDILADYYIHAYGPAAGEMRAYFTTIQDLTQDKIHAGAGEIFTPEVRAQLKAHLDSAARLAQTEGQKARVKLAQDYFHYFTLVRKLAKQPSEAARRELLSFAKSLQDSIAIDYRYHRAVFERVVKVRPEGPSRYAGEPLRPLTTAAPQAAPPASWCTLRGQHGVVLLARKGEQIQLKVRNRQLGRYHDPLAYVLLAPDGKQLASGNVGLNDQQTVAQEAPADGIYNFIASAGSNGWQVDAANQHFCLRAKELKLLFGSRKMYFYVPPGTTEFSLSLTSAAPGETTAMTIYAPDGTVAARGNTNNRTGQFAPKIPVPPGQDGRAWSLRLSGVKGAGVCEDSKLVLGSELPPYLTNAPERLLIPGRP